MQITCKNIERSSRAAFRVTWYEVAEEEEWEDEKEGDDDEEEEEEEEEDKDEEEDEEEEGIADQTCCFSLVQ